MARLSALAALALVAAGCGGAGPRSGGSLAVRMSWSAPPGRLIPAAAGSVLVRVSQGAVVVSDTILTPSSPQATISEVPLGSVTVQATAYPSANATGTPMATAQTTQTVSSGVVSPVSLTMASTISRLSISPDPVGLALLGLFTRQLTVTAYDAGNSVVLTAPGDIAFATSNSLLFHVGTTGMVTGLAVGSATVTATDASSGKSFTAPVIVTLY